MPEMIRKPVEPVKVEPGAEAATGTSSTSATPATSNAPSPSPAATPTPLTVPGTASTETSKANSDASEAKECKEEPKDKDVGVFFLNGIIVINKDRLVTKLSSFLERRR